MSAVSLQSPNLLPSALAWYDTGQLLRYWPAAQGIENANYFVHTGQGDYVLTFLLRESYAGTAYFTILDRLYEAGLPVAPPLPARDGRLQVELDGVPVILQRRLPGSHVTIPTEGQLTALGRLLARVHQHTADLGTRVPLHPRGMMWLRDTAARVSGRLGFRAADLLESSLKSTHSLLRRHDVQELPQGVIHADVFRDNVLFRDNTLTGLVDFHQAARGYWIYDLAVAANDWCCDVNGQLNPDKALALLKGYHAQRPLTRSEIWLFSPFRVMAALSFWLSRLDTTLLANETIRTKNPREMEQLLLALRGGFHYFDERLFG
ncbi:MAG: homoserine kinase [Pseudomonadales bacterium]|nr:homoserine kinase [Pseudomonadales bacterium]MCP5183514.1 homoserine kinase [Pseudomonadales bacterium]